MKITTEHYARLSGILEGAINTLEARNRMSAGEIAASYEDDGLTPKRFRWDVLWSAKIDLGRCPPTNAATPHLPLYGYMDDDHVDTALRYFWSKRLPWAARRVK